MIIDNGLVAGNVCNKYASPNPVVRYLTNGFLSSIQDIIAPFKKDISSVTEVGCGEGHLASRFSEWGYPNIKACDVSALIIDQARDIHKNLPISFYTKSIYDVDASDGADLMVCCEVLEHLENPEAALALLSKTTHRYIALSVPQEPLWRGMNMLRGKYIKDFGNTPGHINHWSQAQFRKLTQPFLNILSVRTPLPWTILLGTPKK